MKQRNEMSLARGDQNLYRGAWLAGDPFGSRLVIEAGRIEWRRIVHIVDG